MAARFPRFHVGVAPFKGRKCAEKVFQSAYRRGCDLRFRQRRGPDSAVSIHAPAWGATQSQRCNTPDVTVSIHAPAWGATWKQGKMQPLIDRFNPRTRVGCDLRPVAMLHVYGRVSIHAPAWGATYGIRYSEALCLVSIHAPAWGATILFDGLFFIDVSFNPRTRVGCDCSSPCRPAVPRPFQSTHPRGVRQTKNVGHHMGGVFQSTHPRGVRRGTMR